MRHIRSSGDFSGFSVACLALLASWVAGCASPPSPKPVSNSERIQFNRTVGLELAHQLEPHLIFRTDDEVMAFLRKVGQTIADAKNDVPIPNVNVALITGVKGDRWHWQDFSLPGGRIYLSVGMLKQMRFQNEVAALLAFQLGRIRKEQVLNYFRVQSRDGNALAQSSSFDGLMPARLASMPENIDYFGPKGVYVFTEQQDIEAAQVAVELMYAAGYDPRGLVALWQTYLDHPTHSPYEEPTLRKILEETRRAIAQKAPLRNPIVRTEAFISIRKRIDQL